MLSARLNEVDKKILEVLRRDGRISYAELAKIVGRSQSAVRKRVQQMLSNEIIERFTLVLNPEKVGKKITASLVVSPSRLRFQRVSSLIESMPEVTEAYYMTGKCGIFAMVQVQDVSKLDEVIEKIQKTGALSVDCCVALKKIK